MRFAPFIGACAAAFVCASAHAATFQPAPHASYSVDLDVPDGHFSFWKLEDVEGFSALRATVSMERLGVDKKWSPTGSFTLRDDTGAVSFRLQAINGAVFGVIAKYEKGAEPQEEIFLAPFKVHEKIALALDWSAEGALVATVEAPSHGPLSNGERREIKLGRTPKTLEISASTGEMLVENLKLGRTEP